MLNSVVRAIAARGGGETILYCSDRLDAPALRPVTVGELAVRVGAAADLLGSRCGQGSRLGLVMSPTLGAVAHLLGALSTPTSVLLVSPASVKHRDAMVERHRLDGWIDPGRGSFDVWSEGSAASDEALAITTSGTSGVARGICLSQANVEHNLAAVVARLSELEVPLAGSTWSLPLELSHSYGVSCLLAVVVGGGAAVLHRQRMLVQSVATDLRQFDVDVLAAVSSYVRMERDLLGAPIDRSAAPALRHRLFAGEGLLQADVRTLLLDEELTLVHMYGMTEHVARVAMGSVRSAEDYMTVGRPLGGVDVRIDPLDGDGHASDGFGEICVRSPSLAVAYTDGSHLPLRDGQYASGDLGIIDGDGRLVVMGRVSERLNHRGYSAWARDVESDIMVIPGVRDCLVEQGAGAESATCSLVLDGSVPAPDVEWQLRRTTSPRGLIGTVQFVERVERTVTGKKFRRSST